MKTLFMTLLFFAVNSRAADSNGYKSMISCVSQTETAQVSSVFKTTIAGSQERLVLSIANINGVELTFKELPTAGPLAVGIFASSKTQGDVALGQFFMAANNSEVSVKGKAGAEDLSVTCLVAIKP